MAGKLALDTNVVSAVISKEPEVLTFVARFDEVYVPSIVIGELYFGAFRSKNTAANLARVNSFLEGCIILHCDESAAFNYGKIKDQLWSKGHPIPDNDIWIAAIAIQHSVMLASRDRHFADISGLRLEVP